MAVIKVEVDTEKPDIMLSIDGETIEGATWITVSKSYYDGEDKPYISIDIPKKMDNGLMTMMRYYSSGEQLVNATIAKDTTTLKGFVGVARLSNDIANFLK
jgi:hypothetical protein